MDIGDSERIMKVYQVKLFATISLFRWNGNVSWRKKKHVMWQDWLLRRQKNLLAQNHLRNLTHYLETFTQKTPGPDDFVRECLKNNESRNESNLTQSLKEN